MTCVQAFTLRMIMTNPIISWPVLWPKPHSAPSKDAAAWLRPIVKGVNACTAKVQFSAKTQNL